MHTPHLIAGQPVVAAAEHGDVFNPSTGEVIARVPRGDVRRGIDVVEFSCGIAHLAKGESLPQVAEQIDAARRPPRALRHRRLHGVERAGGAVRGGARGRGALRGHVCRSPARSDRRDRPRGGSRRSGATRSWPWAAAARSTRRRRWRCSRSIGEPLARFQGYHQVPRGPIDSARAIRTDDSAGDGAAGRQWISSRAVTPPNTSA